ncbi:MAG: permease-like cell division protein FtsX [Candidatus Peribacteraceae bacterium]|nr:permease-like cell division protein FtsX [Candidatus Peribacteraceae bacterium]
MFSMDSQMLVLCRRGMGRGWLTVRRERGWLPTLGVLFGVLLTAQLLLLSVLGAHAAERVLRSQMEVRVDIRSTAADKDIQALYAVLRGLPAVAEAAFVTKEQMYERERQRDPDLIAFLEQFHLANPFRDTVVARVREVEGTDAVTALVRGPEWAGVVDPAFSSKTAEQLRGMREALRAVGVGQWASLLFLCLMGAVLLLVLMETVRRRALGRREEVTVERLTGASDFAVLVPFATEGALLLQMAFFLSVVAVLGGLYLLPAVVPLLWEGAFAPFSREMGRMNASWLPLLLVLEFLALPFLSFLAAWLALRPLLRSPRLSLTGM